MLQDRSSVAFPTKSITLLQVTRHGMRNIAIQNAIQREYYTGIAPYGNERKPSKRLETPRTGMSYGAYQRKSGSKNVQPQKGEIMYINELGVQEVNNYYARKRSVNLSPNACSFAERLQKAAENSRVEESTKIDASDASDPAVSEETCCEKCALNNKWRL